MTARSETVVPVSPLTRQHFTAHRDELHEIAGTIDNARDDLLTDAALGMPVEPDTLRLIRDAADLLTIAARRLDPDQETTP